MEPEAELFRRFAHRIRAFGVRHLAGAVAADDFVQEVMVVVIEALRAGKVREPDKLPSFVLGTCRMVAQGLRARVQRRSRLFDRWAPRGEAVEPAQPLDLEQLSRCLDGLRERERTIVALTFYAELDGPTIATQLGMTPGNVRVTRHRALVQLHGCMHGVDA